MNACSPCWRWKASRSTRGCEARASRQSMPHPRADGSELRLYPEPQGHAVGSGFGDVPAIGLAATRFPSKNEAQGPSMGSSVTLRQLWTPSIQIYGVVPSSLSKPGRPIAKRQPAPSSSSNRPSTCRECVPTNRHATFPEGWASSLRQGRPHPLDIDMQEVGAGARGGYVRQRDHGQPVMVARLHGLLPLRFRCTEDRLQPPGNPGTILAREQGDAWRRRGDAPVQGHLRRVEAIRLAGFPGKTDMPLVPFHAEQVHMEAEPPRRCCSSSSRSRVQPS